MNQTQEMKCPKCAKPFHVTMPVIRVFNQPEVSLISLTHERPQTCPSCGTMFACMIASLDNGIQLTWVEVKTQQTAIVAPTPQDVQAIKRGPVIVRPEV